MILLFRLLNNKKIIKITYFIFSFFLGLIYSLRSIDVGNDTANYLYYYNTVHHDYIPNSTANYYEPLYQFIITYSPTFEIYLFFVSFLSFFLISLSFKNITEWKTAFLFMLTFGFFNIAVDQSRQILALCFLIFSYNYFKRKVFAPIISSFIHLSSLFFIPVNYILSFIENKRVIIYNWMYLILLTLSFIATKYLFWKNIVLLFLTKFLTESNYLAERFFIEEDSSGNLIYYRIILALLFIFLFKKKNFSFNHIFLGLLLLISSNGFIIVERIGYSIFFFGIINASKNILKLNKRNYKAYIIFLYSLIYFVFTVVYNLEKHGSVPWIFNN